MQDISPWRRIIRISAYFYFVLIVVEVVSILGEGSFQFRYFWVAALISLITGVVYTQVIYRRAELVIADDSPELNDWLDFHIQSLGYKPARTNQRDIDVFEVIVRQQLPASGPMLRYHQQGKVHLFGLRRQLEKLENRLHKTPNLSRSATAYFA